jgi:NAD(P)-dependent dehydrogenase (short-subunit alcohol dehydrogenase family)
MTSTDGADRGAVVVTGASTGIGRSTALHLDSLGFRVFAGVRRPEDGESLRAEGSDRLTPLQLEVTDDASIATARATVDAAVGEQGLAGLVNNAGIAVSAPLEFIPLAELRRQLEVNVVGQVAVTQAFLPQLRRARGRIVNIGSIGGRIALPFAGPYAASKFAMEAVTDSLRRELRASQVEVSIIEPGGIKTPIWERGVGTAEEIRKNMSPEGERVYGKAMDTMGALAAEIGRNGLPPQQVAKVVEHALTADRPRTRYLVGRDAKIRAKLAAVLPDRAFDWLVARTLGM